MGDSYSSGDTYITHNKPKVAAIDSLKANAATEADSKRHGTSLEIPLENSRSPPSPSIEVNPGLFRRQTSLDIDDYFSGPRDIAKHSKWPLIMQMHGSITPKLIVPLLINAGWATLITCIHQLKHPLNVNSVLLTILGFVVGLALSFRGSTAYERYSEGRRFWANLVLASQSLGRVMWIHAQDPDDQDPRELTIKKLTGMNLVVAFSVALKHTLRFEPYTSYEDLQSLVGHLDTYAREATSHLEAGSTKRKSFFKSLGEYLGVSFAASNPRKQLKRTDEHLGNLPLEILNNIAMSIDNMCINNQLRVPMQQTLAYNSIATLNDCMVGSERVLNTPLPIAYTIAISQITWLYVIMLPFQLVGLLNWISIPATVAAAYIILGLLLIGQEIENPFGNDVNDLPLETYCEQIADDMDIIASFDHSKFEGNVMGGANLPLYPVSMAPASDWMKRSDEKLRYTVQKKPTLLFQWRRKQNIVHGHDGYKHHKEKSAEHMC